ncbi:MAG: fasciclin domain-containing protein [Prevotella sp.]|nr:fasciclin domain-containing protein [Prevotella sp.]
MEQRQIAKQWRQWLIAACGLLMGASVLQGCKDDFVLTGQPEWLGNSIYERLEEDGNYTIMLKLIDDLGQHEVLSHTGSKTLFVANDSAFREWFTKNSWGVNRYEQLSMSQKKLLLNNSMINNAYLIELMSNGSLQGEDNTPEEGRTMRRETATSIYDSVQILRPSQMPNTEVWAKFKDRGKSIPILKDATTAPMIHFLPVFMKINKMTASDLDILTNHQANNINEAWVNGKKVVERDITCKNGYIQKVDGVIESNPNMAEIIRQHPNMSRWSKLLDRFSAPYYNAAGTREYNRLYNAQDSVYTLRYYSSQSSGGSNVSTPDGKAVNALLRFDPGWNQYINATTDNSLNYDAGAMFVPTNEAIDNWWNNEGKDLKEEYVVIDSIPEATMAKLINVNMLPVFTEAIPSKFDRILNDAKEEMGVKITDVDSCFMGCNGVVYLTNRVFTPAEFASVAYPALSHPSTMNVIYWAISAASIKGGPEKLNFLPYLLSMQSKYSLILPSNNAMLKYLDFASYNTENVSSPTVLEFYYDERKGNSAKVQARRYNCIIDENGEITLGDIIQDNVGQAVINDCLYRLMDQLIIVGDIEDGHEFYKSKGGTLLRVTKSPDGRLALAGGWQTDHNNKILPINNEDIYTKTNGKSYVLNEQAPIATEKSVYMTLQERPEFSEFLKLLEGSDLLKTKSGSRSAGLSKQGNMNLSLFDNYNYTVYVPTNESIKKLIDDGLLPTWDDYDAQTDSIWGSEEAAKEAQSIIKNIIVDFVRYHIQDHSIAINMAPENGKYENSYETMRRNLETSRFYPLTVNHEGGQLWVKDVYGNKRNVVKAEGLYNCICREYWYTGTGNATTTYQASDAVVHQIDGVLLAEEMTPWKSKLNQVRRK